MSELSTKYLIESGVHFGHPTQKWNPNFKKFIAGQKNGIHIIDVNKTIENLNYIQNQINSKILKLNINNYKPKIVAISKTFTMDHILPLIENGHSDFGENKVQEAIDKWTKVKNKNKNIKLHMVGKLQTNKVKFVLPLFDFIHSLDSLKLAKKISEVQKKYENRSTVQKRS